MRFGLLVLCALLNTAWCDYKCICSYVVERDVYSMPSNDSDSIGYLYEFDCKPFITEDADWFTVAYEHKLGYVTKGDKIVIQTCPGQYPDADKISNSSTVSSLSSSNSTISPSSNSYTVEASVPSADATEPPAVLASTHAPTTVEVHTFTTTQSAQQACAALTHQSSTAFANNNICYELVTLHQTFSDAERECMRKGGHLVHIQSMEEQAFLTSNIKHFVGDSYIWIGLQDTGREEHFEWTSGEQLSFTYWYPYRKDFLLHGIEDCVAMRTHNYVKVYDGEWEDLPCSRAHSYICQFEIMTLTVTLVFAAFIGLASCDYKCVCNYNVEKSVQTSPSVQSNVMGYMYEFDCKPQAGVSADADWLPVAYEHKLGYVEVDSQLQVQTCPGAVPDEDKLPTTSAPQTTTMPVTSEAQTTVETTTTAQTTLVVSTTQNPATTQTTTMPTTSTTTVALTTESTTVTNPSTLPTTQASTTTATTSTQSTSTLPTTTTTKLTTTTQRITTPKPSILKGHVELCPQRIQQLAQTRGELLAQFGQSCYEIVDSGVSWSHAEAICKGHGGHLIHIANQQEQDFIFDFLVKHHTHTVWLGLHDRNTEESFEWTSGNAVTYENWKPGRKDYRYHNSEDCVFMTPTTGEWDDIQCGGDNALSELLQGHRHAFICQYAVIPSTNTITVTDAVTSPSYVHVDGNTNLCPYRLHQQAARDKGTLAQYGHSCYELVPNAKVSWQHASDICSSRHGHLVYITSSQEQNFIQGFMRSHFPDHAVWIGLTDRNTEGRFHWGSGQNAQYTNWVPGHIANYASSSQEDCVALIPYKNGQWDDIPCGHTHHSIFVGTSSSGETHPLLCEYSISTGPSIIG